MATYVIEYTDLAELLHRSKSPLALSELHGGLCGVICASGRDVAQSWLDNILDDCAGDGELLATLASRLEQLCDESMRALGGLSLEFAPLLPDDDADIDQRADALALWCHGFLAGLVIGGLDLVGGQSELSNEIAEVIADFAEISKAGAATDEIDDTELGDSSLVELVEFVRVGAQYIYEELTQEPRQQRTIH